METDIQCQTIADDYEKEYGGKAADFVRKDIKSLAKHIS